MKKSLLKALCAVLIVCFSVTAFTSCGEAGAFSNNRKTVMEISGYKVTYDEYRWFYYNCMIDMEANAKADGTYAQLDFASADTIAALKSNTETALRKYYAIICLCDRYGIEMSDEDKEEMEAFMESYVASYDSKADYKSELNQKRATGDVYRALYAQTYYYGPYLWDLLISGYDGIIAIDEETVRKDIAENFYHYKQIFIPFVEKSDYVEDKKLAEEAYERLMKGEDFDTVGNDVYEARKKAFSNNDIKPITDAYATLSEKAKKIEETALALEAGELSEVFWAENGEYSGHFIIKRLPVESEYIDKNYEGLLTQSATRRYNEYLEKFASELTVVYDSYYNELSHGMLVSK